MTNTNESSNEVKLNKENSSKVLNVTLAQDTVDVFNEPDENSPTLKKLSKGDSFKIIGTIENDNVNWDIVEIESDIKGYIKPDTKVIMKGSSLLKNIRNAFLAAIAISVLLHIIILSGARMSDVERIINIVTWIGLIFVPSLVIIVIVSAIRKQ